MPHHVFSDGGFTPTGCRVLSDSASSVLGASMPQRKSDPRFGLAAKVCIKINQDVETVDDVHLGQVTTQAQFAENWPRIMFASGVICHIGGAVRSGKIF